jgi:hypothetical protein
VSFSVAAEFLPLSGEAAPMIGVFPDAVKDKGALGVAV